MEQISAATLKLLGDWEIVQLLGAGEYGHVYEIVRKEFGKSYRAALKIVSIPKSNDEITEIKASGMDDRSVSTYFQNVAQSFMREFEVMEQLKGHTNIVSYEDHQVLQHEDGIGWDIVIRMELLTSLTDYIVTHPLTQADVVKLGIDLCKALALCQRYNIIHRDIKPSNIFISELGDFKLGDFGVARTMNHNMSGRTGTDAYMAPEVYYNAKYGISADIYSLGLVLYRLLNENRAPFLPRSPIPITHEANLLAFQRRISGATLPPPVQADAPLAAIVRRACHYDAGQRYASPDEMQAALETLQLEQKNSSVSPEPSKETDTVKHAIPFPFPQDRNTTLSRRSMEYTTPQPTSQCTVDDGTVRLFDPPMSDRQPADEWYGQPEDNDRRFPSENRDDIIRSAYQTQNLSRDFSDWNHKSRKRWWPAVLIILSIVLVLSAVTIGGVLLNLNLPGRATSTTTIPNVIGKTQNDAVTELDAAGFSHSTQMEYTENGEQGRVFSQEPAAGESAEKDRSITLYISLGPEQITVPNVVAKTTDAAVAELKECGLQACIKKKQNSGYKAGYVIAQSIEKGTKVDSGSEITLTVSQASKSTTTTQQTVPNVYNLAESEAITQLQNLNFGEVVVDYDYSDSVSAGYVCSQSKKAGTAVETGDSITIVISIGTQ